MKVSIFRFLGFQIEIFVLNTNLVHGIFQVLRVSGMTLSDLGEKEKKQIVEWKSTFCETYDLTDFLFHNKLTLQGVVC